MHVSLNDLPAVAEKVLTDSIECKIHVLALHGDLGAGKTTFVGVLAKALGVHEQIISPTFIIYRTYTTTHDHFTRLVHVDAYRLEGAADALKIRLNEIFLDPRTLVCVEWPEHVGDVVPQDALHMYFTYHSDSAREITWQKNTKN